MTRSNQVRLSVEVLEDRCTPSGFSFDAPPALAPLSAVAARLATGPPIRESAVFVLNFNTPTTDTLHALNGLTMAGTHVLLVGPPFSPVFYGLANLDHPT